MKTRSYGDYGDNVKSAAKSEPVVGIYQTLQVQFHWLPLQPLQAR